MSETIRSILTAAFLGCLASGPASIAATATRTPPVGVNLYTQTTNATDIPFVDVFKMSAPWQPAILTPGVMPGPLALDAKGWVLRLAPGQGAITHIFQDGLGRYPGGVYSLFYDGQGQLEVSGAGVAVVSKAPGLMKVQVNPTPGPNGGITILERTTDPANPIRRIRMVMPGFETRYLSDPFNPQFIERLKPFKALRFMDWQKTLRSGAEEWRDERTPDYETQASAPCCAFLSLSGVALEYQIDLANRIGADPWFNVPARASDDFVRHMADLVHRRLRPDLHPYIEYGNETWNPRDRQSYDYITNKGLAALLSLDPKTANIYQYVTRSAEIFRIWSSVFGADSTRLRRVISAITYDPKLDDTALTYLKSHGWQADVLAIELYVTPRTLVSWKPVGDDFYDAVLRLTPAEVVARVDEEIEKSSKSLIVRHAAAGRRYGMALAAYEGGQDLHGLGMDPRQVPAYRDKVTALFIAANRDPSMGRMYKHLLDTWFGNGGGLLILETAIAKPDWYGSWGLLEYQNQDPSTAVKYRAVLDYLGVKTPAPTPR